MINLNIKINKKLQKVEIREEVLFNTFLYERLDTIKQLIKLIHPRYKIDPHQFKVINKFIELDSDLVSVYPGLIVKTKFDTYATLYLENTMVDEEYMISLIKDYIYDTQENIPKIVNIDKFEVTKEDFLKVIKNIEE